MNKTWYYISCHFQYEAKNKEQAMKEIMEKYPFIHIDYVDE